MTSGVHRSEETESENTTSAEKCIRVFDRSRECDPVFAEAEPQREQQYKKKNKRRTYV